MAYSEAEVLAGGLAHIPVLVGLLLFFNSAIRSRLDKSNKQDKKTDSGEDTSSETSKEIIDLNARLKDEEKERQLITERRKAQEIESQLLNDKRKAEEKLKEELKRQKANAEAQKRIEKEEEEDFTAKLQAEANRLEAESELETRLKAETVRLEAESSQTNNSSETNELLPSFLSSFNPWQIAAVALLAIGGAGLYLIESPEKYKDNELTSELKIEKIIREKAIKHTIKRGETLSGLARKYNVSLKGLISLNDIRDPSNIREGTVLFINKSNM
ncbi:LysM peptidoglycan-binding domain-containing protein [Prochlorococcus sp. MIT 1300]|uniref:LysM peptidoglycan-binding domain-containing protein n=1 Tax=Prochlorococcus sp. MIT 1300 TaxID=3096218 RepID=UPI002A755FF5|nr:LysM peptidoglycan-binding domain-containing protein [Prochlorococcus sp. MIT 1300]